MFKVLGEKLPIGSLDDVADEVRQRGFGGAALRFSEQFLAEWSGHAV